MICRCLQINHIKFSLYSLRFIFILSVKIWPSGPVRSELKGSTDRELNIALIWTVCTFLCAAKEKYQKKGRPQLCPAGSLAPQLPAAGPETRFAQTVRPLLPQATAPLGCACPPQVDCMGKKQNNALQGIIMTCPPGPEILLFIFFLYDSSQSYLSPGCLWFVYKLTSCSTQNLRNRVLKFRIIIYYIIVKIKIITDFVQHAVSFIPSFFKVRSCIYKCCHPFGIIFRIICNGFV